jgi:hypothetical protein
MHSLSDRLRLMYQINSARIYAVSDRLRLIGVDQINSARIYAFSQTGSDLPVWIR